MSDSAAPEPAHPALQPPRPTERGRLWRSARVPAEGALRAWGAATASLRPPPDFLMIGGKRCGTTTLYYGLLQHPAILPQVLSAGWLPLSEHRKGTRWLDAPRRGGPWYRAHFATTLTRARTARRHGAAVTGEATPWYLFAPGAAERAAIEAPRARIVAVLREPVLRTWSQFMEQRARGHEPLADFAAALAAEDERTRVGVVLADGSRRSAAFATEHLTYRGQSEYDRGLAPWLEHFPRAQVLVVRSEDLYADVPATLHHVADFVGVGDVGGVGGVGGFGGFAFQAEHRNRAARGLPDVALAADLRAHFRPHNERLAALLGTTPWWE